MRSRRGISLLEIMFSMGVIAVGLLGVTAVLPLALSQVGRGRVLDNAARMGQNATTEFRVRQMADPTTWRAAKTLASGPLGTKGSNFVTPSLSDNQGFCIDPLFVAKNVDDTSTAPYDARVFPYYNRVAAADPRMQRISLAAPVTTFNPSGMMRWAGAERVFILQDELVFDVPEEEAAPPIQNFGSSGANRMYNGSTSWLATLSPNLDVTNQIHEAYTLSIVVFENRNLLMPMDGDTERLLSVIWPAGSGLGGGDLILQASSVSQLSGIHAGKWIMLMGNVSVNVKAMPQFRWYRIVATDVEPIFNSGSGTYTLDVTLQGPDWNPSITTTGVFMPGVVAVYDRSIHLEANSLWRN